MNLNNKNIDIAVENIQKFFESVNVSNKDKIKLCFLFEESLLRYQEKFGEDIDFEFITKKWLGTPKVLIKIKGKPYNPLENDNDEQIFSENIMRNLLKYDQAKIVYSYENGYNELHAISTKKAKKIKIPGGSNTIAIFFALIFAFILKNFSQDIQNDIVEYIISPILNTLFGAIIAANIPLIFISIVASICGIEDVTTLNKIGSKVLKKFASTIFFCSSCNNSDMFNNLSCVGFKNWRKFFNKQYS